MVHSFRLSTGPPWIKAMTSIADVVMKISPSCTLTTGIGKLALTARANAYCEHNHQFCNLTILHGIGITDEECCGKCIVVSIPFLATTMR